MVFQNTYISVIGELRQGISDLTTKNGTYFTCNTPNFSRGNLGGKEENSWAPKEVNHFIPTSTMSSVSFVMPFFLVDTDFTPPFAQLSIWACRFHFVISSDKLTLLPVIPFGKGRHFFQHISSGSFKFSWRYMSRFCSFRLWHLIVF